MVEGTRLDLGEVRKEVSAEFLDPNICPNCESYWNTPQHYYGCDQSQHVCHLTESVIRDGLMMRSCKCNADDMIKFFEETLRGKRNWDKLISTSGG